MATAVSSVNTPQLDRGLWLGLPHILRGAPVRIEPWGDLCTTAEILRVAKLGHYHDCSERGTIHVGIAPGMQDSSRDLEWIERPEYFHSLRGHNRQPELSLTRW